MVESISAHLHYRLFSFGVVDYLPSDFNTNSKALLWLVVGYRALSDMVSGLGFSKSWYGMLAFTKEVHM